MNKMIDSLFNICFLEEIARRNNWVNQLHPFVKSLVTIVYIISVAAVPKYNLQLLILYGVYPVLMIAIADIPFGIIGKKMILPMMLGGSLGILNPIFDDNMIYLGRVIISAGWLSLITLMLKSVLMITSSLLLIATTKIEDVAMALRMLKVPKVMVIQFLLTYRYITLLINEVNRTVTAYSMRSSGDRSIGKNAWGSLVGQVFMRVSNRSIILYEAMSLRGFKGDFPSYSRKLKLVDYSYLSFWIFVFGTFIGMRTM